MYSAPKLNKSKNFLFVIFFTIDGVYMYLSAENAPDQSFYF